MSVFKKILEACDNDALSPEMAIEHIRNIIKQYLLEKLNEQVDGLREKLIMDGKIDGDELDRMLDELRAKGGAR